jgi:ABC-type multidrug transport system ATPase subunit
VRTQVTAAADMTIPAATPTGTSSASAVVVAGLRKSYGAVQAVRGVSFTVSRGEIFALIGPNGAGKTTILEILEGFRARDAGRVEVLGADPGDRSGSEPKTPMTAATYPEVRNVPAPAPMPTR